MLNINVKALNAFYLMCQYIYIQLYVQLTIKLSRTIYSRSNYIFSCDTKHSSYYESVGTRRSHAKEIKHESSNITKDVHCRHKISLQKCSHCNHIAFMCFNRAMRSRNRPPSIHIGLTYLLMPVYVEGQ